MPTTTDRRPSAPGIGDPTPVSESEERRRSVLRRRLRDAGVVDVRVPFSGIPILAMRILYNVGQAERQQAATLLAEDMGRFLTETEANRMMSFHGDGRPRVVRPAVETVDRSPFSAFDGITARVFDITSGTELATVRATSGNFFMRFANSPQYRQRSEFEDRMNLRLADEYAQRLGERDMTAQGTQYRRKVFSLRA